MPTRVLVASDDGGRVFSLGRVGFDAAGSDPGGVYTGTLRTERFSPAGEGGLVHFRRVQVRCWHTGAFTITLTVYVDGVRTRLYSGDTLVDQSITFVQAAPTVVGEDGGTETILEAAIDAEGTYLEAQLVLDSDALTGVVLPESIPIGFRIIRPGLQRAAEVS
jgi:hypothetical protein